MMSKSNRLCNAYVLNTSEKSIIKAFEIVTMRELPDYNGGTIIEEVKTAEEFLNTDEEGIDQPFYRVFALFKEGYFKKRKAISDFYDIKEAVTFLEELTGNKVDIYSY